MRQLILIAHNIRSAHNVGSLLRTADGLGAKQVLLTGYTPYPRSSDDQRLPHIGTKAEHAIDKTALGAQNSVDWQHFEQLEPAINQLRGQGFLIVALEQTKDSVPLNQLPLSSQVALIVGNEVEGLSPKELKLADLVAEIPMHGKKESFNVSIAAAIALYGISDK